MTEQSKHMTDEEVETLRDMVREADAFNVKPFHGKYGKFTDQCEIDVGEKPYKFE